jgi:hypothetical protein
MYLREFTKCKSELLNVKSATKCDERNVDNGLFSIISVAHIITTILLRYSVIPCCDTYIKRALHVERKVVAAARGDKMP